MCIELKLIMSINYSSLVVKFQSMHSIRPSKRHSDSAQCHSLFTVAVQKKQYFSSQEGHLIGVGAVGGC